MIISVSALAILVKAAFAVTVAAPFILLFLLIKDNKRKTLW